MDDVIAQQRQARAARIESHQATLQAMMDAGENTIAAVLAMAST